MTPFGVFREGCGRSTVMRFFCAAGGGSGFLLVTPVPEGDGLAIATHRKVTVDVVLARLGLPRENLCLELVALLMLKA